jgi:DNA invertase Pin-like site-specific DNA recombinase
MIAVLGGLTDVERDLIRTRTAEGRSRARARGQQMGQPPALNTAAAERGHPTPRRRCYARRTRPQLCRGHIHQSPRDTYSMTIAPQQPTAAALDH